jgi:hypothetical protein
VVPGGILRGWNWNKKDFVFFRSSRGTKSLKWAESKIRSLDKKDRGAPIKSRTLGGSTKKKPLKGWWNPKINWAN